MKEYVKNVYICKNPQPRGDHKWSFRLHNAVRSFGKTNLHLFQRVDGSFELGVGLVEGLEFHGFGVPPILGGAECT
jgi:hypothetical protein